MKCRVSALVLLALVLSLSLVRPAHAAKLLAITFDDGASPVYTPQALAELTPEEIQKCGMSMRKADNLSRGSRRCWTGWCRRAMRSPAIPMTM